MAIIKRIFVESDNLQPLIDWLRTKPEGHLIILIAGVFYENQVAKLFAEQGVDFVLWALQKTERGEIELLLNAQKPNNLPVGVVEEIEV
jgi:hypothetical protein